MTKATSELMDVVFGVGSRGTDARERARSSDVEFVRGQHMLAKASDGARGRRLAASEALALFGFDHLVRAATEGQSVFAIAGSEPADTIRERRIDLGYDRKGLARYSKVSEDDVVRAETAGEPVPIRTIEKLAPWLALDEGRLGAERTARGDRRLGVRLKSLRGTASRNGLPSKTVASLAEAAWVSTRQSSLERLLSPNVEFSERSFEPSDDYHSPQWRVGYELAVRTRQLLGLDPDEPILSMRRLVEDRLRLPLVNCEIDRRISGATIASKGARGIVLNVDGDNRNPWVRRMTLAHELGHLLWDPEERLDRLRVDSYEVHDQDRGANKDPVEARTNAFAVALLAPPVGVQKVVASCKTATSALDAVCQTYGISVTAAVHHIRNNTNLSVGNVSRDEAPSPTDDWRGREDLTIDYFPITEVPISRRGRFAWLTVTAAKERLISWDSAAAFLGLQGTSELREREYAIISSLDPSD